MGRAEATDQTARTAFLGVYRVAAKQKFVGIVDNQPDEEAAIEAAIEEYRVPSPPRDRLAARRWP